MGADLNIKAGDTQPPLNATLSYSDQSPVDLNGMSVNLQLRSMTSPTPLTLTGDMTVVDAAEGQVSFTFSPTDTATPGNYLAVFVVTSGGDQMTFPTDGYLWVEVQPSLASEAQQLISLPDIKMQLDIPTTDRNVDIKLIRLLEAARPMIENVTGPIIPTTYDEKYEGGNNIITLRHRPSAGYGTSPVLNLIGVSEFRGPIEYPMSLVANPVLGSIYSCELDSQLGTITRRAAGGGTIPWQVGRNSVHAVYQAGQSSVPWNVYEATLEVVRSNYMTTQAVGSGSASLADEDDRGTSLPFFMPRRALELLGPMRRHPSLA